MLWPAGGDLDSWFVTVPVRHGIWMICEPGHVQSFLVEGDERAVLLDTGTGIAPIAPVARGLATRPLSVVLTHNHFDHVGGNGDFDQIAIHSAGVAGLRAGRSNEQLRGYIAHTREMIEQGRQMGCAASFRVKRPWG